MYCIIEYAKMLREQRIEAPIAPIITNAKGNGVKGGSECFAFAFAGEAGTACPPIEAPIAPIITNAKGKGLKGEANASHSRSPAKPAQHVPLLIFLIMKNLEQFG